MSKKIILYETMHYPYPQHEEYYRYINEVNHKEKYEKESFISDTDQIFSRNKPCELMDEYREHILSFSNLFMSLPFVRQIYLCNSITFNALRPGSDIDICIICQSGYVRTVRIRSVILFLWYKVKRSGGKYHNHSKKFCLSFYIDETVADLYPVRHSEGDRYLVYWLAHAVLLYSDGTLSDNFLWQKNKKLLSFLPGHPQKQSINIGISPIYGTNSIKKYIQILSKTRPMRFIIFMIKYIRQRRIYYKLKKLSVHIKKYIIVSDTILKFYDDKRHLIQHKVKTMLSKG